MFHGERLLSQHFLLFSVFQIKPEIQIVIYLSEDVLSQVKVTVAE